MTDPVVELRGLGITTTSGLRIVEDVDLVLMAGDSVGLVGESGSGKTAVAHAILGYARRGLRLTAGSIRVAGRELRGLDDRALRGIRGGTVAYVPQDPPSALNPSLRVADQVREVQRSHASTIPVADVLARVDLPSDRAFLRRYPHQLSGGQQQRLAIAMAISCDPAVIVLDEPTTGLDVITQATILAEIRRLQRERAAALVYVSHDLAAVASVVDRVAVMYAGEIVEEGPVGAIVRRPYHPYTSGLVSSVPDPHAPRRLVGIAGVALSATEVGAACAFAGRCAQSNDTCRASRPALTPSPIGFVRCFRWQETRAPAWEPRGDEARAAALAPLLDVRDLHAGHQTRRGRVVAADGVGFTVDGGECVALVGQSGSGKTTIARTIAGLHRPDRGSITLAGEALPPLAHARPREQRRRIQIVFQNPYESLNPRQTVEEAVSWPARTLRGLDRSRARAEVTVLLERVGLPARIARHFPTELSGGERQRVAIARALAAQPDLLVCDEITSALDVSIQAAALELLAELRRELDLAMLFITHDLGVVAAIADRVLVLDQGVICEQGATAAVLREPTTDYTRSLVAAAPALLA